MPVAPVARSQRLCFCNRIPPSRSMRTRTAAASARNS